MKPNDLHKHFLEKSKHNFDVRIEPKNALAALPDMLKVDDPKTLGIQYSLKFSNWALGQYLSAVGVPTKFYKKCPLSIRADIWSHFSEKQNDKYLIRVQNHAPGSINGVGSRIGTIRAVLSKTYGIVNNHDLFKILEPLTLTMMVDDIRETDNLVQVVYKFPDCSVTFQGNQYSAGFSVVNSETGQSSVWVEPVIFRNDTMFYDRRTLAKEGHSCRIIHRGSIGSDRVASLIIKAKEIAQIGIMGLPELLEETMTGRNIAAVIKQSDYIPSRWQKVAQNLWTADQEVTKAEFMKELMELAVDLPLFQSIQVQQEASRVIGVFKGYKTRFANLKIGMQNAVSTNQNSTQNT